jgi:predicted DNA-binding protein (UPF0251 family)
VTAPLTEIEIEVLRLAKLTPLEYERERKSAAEKLGIERLSVLDREVAKARAKLAPPPEAAPIIDTDAIEAAAGDLIKCENVLARFGKSIEADGLVQETDNAKLLYLALTSRLLDDPVSIAVKGVSAGGKSYTVERVLAYFPEDAYFARTGLSDHALIFSEQTFQHRHLVIYEALGMDGEKLAYFIRTLLSEKRITYETVQKAEGGMRPLLIEKEGPTGILTTTTATSLHPENETRMLSLGVKDTREQTAAVLAKMAENQSVATRNLSQWQAFQEWVALGEKRVVIPYAVELAKGVEPVAVRLRRDFRMILTLIEAHALLHRTLRGRDQAGRIVATIADYAAVYALLADLITEGTGTSVNATVRETVAAVLELIGLGKDFVSHHEIADHMKLDRSVAGRRVRRAITEGYLQNLEIHRKRKAQITLGEPLPDKKSVLPHPDMLSSMDPAKPACPSALPADNEALSGTSVGQAPLPKQAGSALDNQLENIGETARRALGHRDSGGSREGAHAEPPKTEVMAAQPNGEDFQDGGVELPTFLDRRRGCGTAAPDPTNPDHATALSAQKGDAPLDMADPGEVARQWAMAGKEKLAFEAAEEEEAEREAAEWRRLNEEAVARRAAARANRAGRALS